MCHLNLPFETVRDLRIIKENKNKKVKNQKCEVFHKSLHRLSECENYCDQYHKIAFFYTQNVVNFAALPYNDYTFILFFLTFWESG